MESPIPTTPTVITAERRFLISSAATEPSTRKAARPTRMGSKVSSSKATRARRPSQQAPGHVVLQEPAVQAPQHVHDRRAGPADEVVDVEAAGLAGGDRPIQPGHLPHLAVELRAREAVGLAVEARSPDERRAHAPRAQGAQVAHAEGQERAEHEQPGHPERGVDRGRQVEGRRGADAVQRSPRRARPRERRGSAPLEPHRGAHEALERPCREDAEAHAEARGSASTPGSRRRPARARRRGGPVARPRTPSAGP